MRFSLGNLGLLIVCACFSAVPMAHAVDADWKVMVNADNSFGFRVLAGDQAVLSAGTVGWGPGWSWIGIHSDQKAEGERLRVTSPMTIGGRKPTITLDVQEGGPRQAVFDYTIRSDEETPITQIVATIGVPPGVRAHAVFTPVSGPERKTDLPMNIAEFGLMKQITLTSPAWKGAVAVALDPPLVVGGDKDLRLKLASETLRAGTTHARLSWTFPADAALLTRSSDVLKYAPVVPTSDWFAYRPTWKPGPSAIGFEDWLGTPAGKHGGVRTKGDLFVFEDGTPVKFWGTNLSYGASAPPRDEAEFTARRFARFGVNAVRMHKFTGAGWEGIGDEQTAVKMKPDGLDRLDYFSDQLRQRGVYYGWSHTYHFRVKPGDRARISGFDELMKKGGDTYGVLNWAEDAQDLMIEMVVNLLQHRNPYTGTTYADDPALAYIELQNEDDIFFYTSDSAYNDFPTYRKLLQRRFAEWLQTKYGTQRKLTDAWDGALQPGEELAAANIGLRMNPWMMGDQHLPQTKGGERRRLLDNASFLFETQNRFYSRFVQAIRAAGYKGPLVGSPWQAAGGLPHYLNLRADDLVGTIDRHNYFGGGFTDSMLAAPGSGYFWTGLQQVAGKPFGVSEWIHVYPSLYSAEGPVIMAAYGLGLQGWGASYEFQSTAGRLDPSRTIVGNQPFGVWNADAPTQIGQYPILARMIARGDVQTAPAISVRRVSPENLATGAFNFADTVRQSGDVKTFTGSVPAESLAAGRALVEFVDQTTPSTIPDLARYTQGPAIVSATGQLRWDTSGGGVITINTPGTQGYVGFAQGQRLKLDALTIEPSTPYAAVLVTAADPGTTLADAPRALISAVARNANSGFRILTLDNRTIVDNGKPPILLEPVKADITTRRKIARVSVLDHDGQRTGRTLPVSAGKFTIDGARDHALYYEVVFGPAETSPNAGRNASTRGD